MRDLTLSEQYDLFVEKFIVLEPYYLKGMVTVDTLLFCDFVQSKLIKINNVPTRANIEEAARLFHKI